MEKKDNVLFSMVVRILLKFFFEIDDTNFLEYIIIRLLFIINIIIELIHIICIEHSIRK